MPDTRRTYKKNGFLFVEGVLHEIPFQVKIDTINREAVFVEVEDETVPVLPGTIFKRMLFEKFSVTATCSSCNEVVHFMNMIGPESCRRCKPMILEDIWGRRNQLTGWRKALSSLPGVRVAAMMELGRIFDEAVQEAEAHGSS